MFPSLYDSVESMMRAEFHSLMLIHWHFDSACRRTQNIQILNTKTLGKPCGLRAGIIHPGWSPSWHYWTWEWVLLMIRKPKWPTLLLILISHLIKLTLDSFKLFPTEVSPNIFWKILLCCLACIICKLVYCILDC